MNNKLYPHNEKYSFNEYRDGTIGTGDEYVDFFPLDSTTIPKSKYDNVVGQIKLPFSKKPSRYK